MTQRKSMLHHWMLLRVCIVVPLLLGCEGSKHSSGFAHPIDTTAPHVAVEGNFVGQTTPSLLASSSILARDAGISDAIDSGTKLGERDSVGVEPRCPVLDRGSNDSTSVHPRTVDVYVEMFVGPYPAPYREIVEPQRIELRIPAIRLVKEIKSCYWLPLNCRLELTDKASVQYIYGTDMLTVHGRIAQQGNDVVVVEKSSEEDGEHEYEFGRFPLPCGAQAHMIVRAPKKYNHLYNSQHRMMSCHVGPNMVDVKPRSVSPPQRPGAEHLSKAAGRRTGGLIKANVSWSWWSCSAARDWSFTGIRTRPGGEATRAAAGSSSPICR